MLKTPRKTKEFRAWLYERLSTLFPTFHREITHLADVIDKIYLLDLDPALDIIASRYSHTGRPSREPTAMFRALVCGAYLGISSITKLVARLRSSPPLATIAGFDPDDIPGVGTFYDFMYRLWGEDKRHLVERKRRTRSPKNKDQAPFVDGPVSKPDKHLSETLAKAVMDNSFPLDPDSIILAQIFDRCALAKSEEMGLVSSPDGRGILLSGDGTLVRSGASSSGIKECDCRKKSIHKCDCPRRFSDPDARFGKDAHKDAYVFGYNMYTIVAITSSGPLPVASACHGANTNDCIMNLFAFNSLLYCRKTRPATPFRILGFIGDGAHDVTACYKVIAWIPAQAFIPLNQRTIHPERTLPGPVNITPDGTPICPAGYPMRYYGRDLVKIRLKWRCPMIYGSKKDRARINCQTPCSSSPFGRVVHTKPTWDLRVHCYPPRSSPEWKKTYALRYQSEQMNNLLKNGYNIENLRPKDRCRAVWGQTLANIGIHLTAQAARASPGVVQTLAKQAS